MPLARATGSAGKASLSAGAASGTVTMPPGMACQWTSMGLGLPVAAVATVAHACGTHTRPVRVWPEPRPQPEAARRLRAGGSCLQRQVHWQVAPPRPGPGSGSAQAREGRRTQAGASVRVTEATKRPLFR
jgi:hypothetical protein